MRPWLLLLAVGCADDPDQVFEEDLAPGVPLPVEQSGPPRPTFGIRLQARVVPGAFLRGDLEVRSRPPGGPVDCDVQWTVAEVASVAPGPLCATCDWAFDVRASARVDLLARVTGTPSTCARPAVLRATLVHDAASGEVRVDDGSGWRAFDHVAWDPAAAELDAWAVR